MADLGGLNNLSDLGFFFRSAGRPGRTPERPGVFNRPDIERPERPEFSRTAGQNRRPERPDFADPDGSRATWATWATLSQTAGRTGARRGPRRGLSGIVVLAML
jgi:hypothetical protein